MSAAVVQAALVAALRDAASLDALTAVFDAPPVRSALPYAVVEEPVLARWGGSGIVGREGRVTVSVHDAGERPVRLRSLVAAVEDVAAALGGEIGGGWRLVALRLVRSRVTRSGGGERWVGQSEFSLRVYRVEG